jgi:hypothetical protein
MDDSPNALVTEAGLLALEVGKTRALLAAEGSSDPVMDGLARQLSGVLERASRLEAEALVAASETLDPERFGRRVRARRAMQALRKRKRKREPRMRRAATPDKRRVGEDLFPPPPPTEPAAFTAATAPTRVVRRG